MKHFALSSRPLKEITLVGTAEMRENPDVFELGSEKKLKCSFIHFSLESQWQAFLGAMGAASEGEKKERKKDRGTGGAARQGVMGSIHFARELCGG